MVWLSKCSYYSLHSPASTYIHLTSVTKWLHKKNLYNDVRQVKSVRARPHLETTCIPGAFPKRIRVDLSEAGSA